MPTDLIYDKTAGVVRPLPTQIGWDYRFASSDSHAQSASNRDQTDRPRMSKDKQTALQMRRARTCGTNYYSTFSPE